MNRIIKQASLIGLFMLAVTVGVKAQGSQQYRADIPFSFEVNGKQHAAGEYIVGAMSQVSAPGAIALRNLKSGRAQVLGVTSQQGDIGWDNPGKLTFLKTDGRYTLSQISTATFKMKMKVQKARNSELAKEASDPAVVAIDLKK